MKLIDKTVTRMLPKRNLGFLIVIQVILILSAAIPAQGQGVRDVRDLFGPGQPAQEVSPSVVLVPPPEPEALPRLIFWNRVTMDANALDHTPVRQGENRSRSGEQAGPTRTARAFAIVHIAISDAVNAIHRRYNTYTDLEQVPASTSLDAAIAQAAHDTLIALYPAQKPKFDQLLANDLALIPNGNDKTRGIALGSEAAAKILALRANDGSQHNEPCVVLPCPTGGLLYTTSNLPGRWRRDPIGLSPLALGALWRVVTPFVLTSASQFRTPPPPLLTSSAYTAAFNEVKQKGGDGVITPTNRTADQTIAGIYWGYDGTPSLGTPPRLYNQIAVHIASQRGTDVIDLARLLALLNVGMADAGLAAWDSKYQFDFWRPITGIREADPGTGPTGAGDGNPATIGDTNFTPLGAPASNLFGPNFQPNFTPPFPAYPSGHATFGATLFQTLRLFYGTDAIAFSFVSDEFNGVTRDNKGNIRPRVTRNFSSLSHAEEENGQSRIYLGIHWAFDKTEGIIQGRRVANYVFANTFTPQ
jgi:PAP2 superfamily protein